MALYLGNQKIVPVLKSDLTTKRIVTNGTYNAVSDNADGYSTVVVNVPNIGGVGIPREITQQGVYQMPSDEFVFTMPDGVTKIGEYALAYAQYNCANLVGVDLSNVVEIGSNGLRSAFCRCANLTSVDLSDLVEVGNYGLMYAFNNCPDIVNVDLSSLTTIGSNGFEYAFSYCKGLTSVNFPNLINIEHAGLYSAFMSCSNLRSLSFPSLTSASFSGRYDQFTYMLFSVTGCTVHFPSNLQSVIGSWSDVQSGFGGTNTTVLFDLTATT